MKNSPACPERRRRAFTIVELLVVIAIIGILAAIILPALQGAQRSAKVKKAQLEISQIVQAIQSYYSTYSRYPVSSNAMYFAAQAREDFTYGTNGIPTVIFNVANPATVDYNANNSEVIAILMDLTDYPGGGLTVNSNHVKNPQQIKFLNAKMAVEEGGPGVGRNLVYRDPWLNPYVISMDLNYDDKCMDAFYRLQGVSQENNAAGYNGLFNSVDVNGSGPNFGYNGGVMVWSVGPDRNASTDEKALSVPNKDNVLSWK